MKYRDEKTDELLNDQEFKISLNKGMIEDIITVLYWFHLWKV